MLASPSMTNVGQPLNDQCVCDNLLTLGTCRKYTVAAMNVRTVGSHPITVVVLATWMWFTHTHTHTQGSTSIMGTSLTPPHL